MNYRKPFSQTDALLEQLFKTASFSRFLEQNEAVMQMQNAFGFPLTVEEAQKLLRIAGKSPLYPRLKRDAAIIFCLNRRDSMVEVQLLLNSLGLSLLGEE